MKINKLKTGKVAMAKMLSHQISWKKHTQILRGSLKKPNLLYKIYDTNLLKI